VCVASTLIWTGTFSTMAKQEQMTVGYYGNLSASDQGTYSPIYGGMFWHLPWSICTYCTWTTGWFVVDSVTYSEGSLNSIQLRFAQYCGGYTSVLYRALNWAAANPSYPLGPLLPPPTYGSPLSPLFPRATTFT